MTTLHLIRHGETTANAAGRFQGRQDTPLSERGRAQALLLRGALATAPLDAVATSTLQRAAETAAILAAPHRLVPQADPRWQELDVGQWQGLSLAEIAVQWPAEYALWQAGSPAFRPPGGEPLAELLARVAAATDELCARHRGRTVVIVAHGLALRASLAHLLSAGPDFIPGTRLDNASVSTVRIAEDGQVELCRLNDGSHLPCGSDARPSAASIV